ncbi:lipoyl domain-containing protein [Aliiroseovarius sp. F47248L]|uniref:lipoyl domain-containing protein n=1 Tax=Aliiroseovarius sp. F47248L TaxID=2926420 RepID=UPI001FF464D9|nr:lipoyl domain-containing protein [Aliiroseovarius sp. F47248L]MCK0139867.1 lipoyl domain-containing protein [Aliiroseovarius sp. F47248L]
MTTNIIIPTDLWEEDEETVITTWLVSDGAAVEEGALLAEIMTAKVQYEINAPASGTVSITEEADAVVPKGAVIGTIS